MAIEDILQVTDRVTERDYNPLGDPQTVNQTEFLRFQEQMGLGVDGIMAKLIQMFVEAPSDFTRQFGGEAADSVREFLGNQTQRELEEQGNVFRDNSAEIIGKNISMNLPENSAIGTLQTDQANQAEMMLEFMKRQLQFDETTGKSIERFRVLGHVQAQEMGLPVDSGQIYQMNEMTGKVEMMEDLSPLQSFDVLSKEQAMDMGLNVDQGQIWQRNNVTGEVKQLQHASENFRILSEDESKMMGVPTDQGQIYQVDEITGNVKLMEGTKTSSEKHRVMNVEEAQEMGLPVDQGQIWELNQMTGQVNLLDTGDAEKPEWITKKDKEWITKKDKEEKNFLVDIMKDIIQGGMETGSGIINAIMEEAKQLYREHTEQSPDYDPKFFEKEILNETTEDYYPPQP